MKSQISQRELEIEGQRIPVTIFRERRHSIRFAVGKRAVTLRLPAILTEEEQAAQWERFKGWIAQQLHRKPGLLEQFAVKTYRDGDIFWVGKRMYELRIVETDGATHSGRLKNGIIYLRLNTSVSQADRQKATEHLLSRVVAGDFQQAVTQRVLELNALHFKTNLQGVRLKYNHSNWGSCSAKGNINLSTRLLFAPDEVIDYVIIHELAHRLEMNHSPRFWKLVEAAMPDYKSRERWLNENGHLCRF